MGKYLLVERGFESQKTLLHYIYKALKMMEHAYNICLLYTSDAADE